MTTEELSAEDIKQGTKIFKEWVEKNDLARLTLHVDWPTWGKFQLKVRKTYHMSNKKSYVLRILIIAWIEGLIDLEDVITKLEASPREYFVGGETHPKEGEDMI